ncbi:MAG: AAA family ATPase [Planctomycetia bacterium]|nr:AAA family ATPase [Planctomycetia bacterium]
MAQKPDPAAAPQPFNPANRWRLKPSELDVAIDPAELGFRTTDDLEPLDQIVGQERAMRALDFGLAVRHRGYNIYIAGMTGAGRKQLVQRLLEKRALHERVPDDWVYVHNFDEPDRPLALCLASGQGTRLRAALERIVERLCTDLPEILKAKDFDAERDRLGKAYGQRSEALFDELVQRARQLDTGIRKLPSGVIAFIPLKDGRPIERQDVERLSDEERADIERRQAELGEFAAEIMTRQQELSRQLREEIQKIVCAFARRVVDPLFDEVKSEHPSPELVKWLDRVRDHMLENLGRFTDEREEAGVDVPPALRAAVERRDPWTEFRVNVVADNSRTQGAPVVVEISPTYKNLYGTIEHDVNLFGRVTTNFTRIKTGSLLRANGGYLVFDLEDALTEPLVWKQLKRALKSGQLLTEVYEPFGLLATTALKPEPIPIDTKIVVLGSAQLYYLLHFLDDDFRELFKVRADFSPETRRDAETQRAYARFVARQVQVEKLPPFEPGAVAEIIRFGAREAAHQEKLSVEFGTVADVVREAGHAARLAGAVTTAAPHVRQALEGRVYRSDRIAAKLRELIDEGTLRISIEGARAGQINGLSVWDQGDYRFGRPSRVTASVGIGQEGLVNIERECDLSGGTHDKGVLILEGYLRNRYARAHSLALSASIAFEQSYGWVEGDSASSAELYCLLSALAGIPLRQEIAVTGSVNQHGEVQGVGAVNEKIEGFFDVCRLKGLTGTQGVCIPRSNVRHLVLRHDVIEAAGEGRFHVWAIDTIDEGIELLTGVPAGDLDREGTFHRRVDERLQEILDVLQEQPGAAGPSRVRFAPAAAKTPSPPPLPPRASRPSDG